MTTDFDRTAHCQYNHQCLTEIQRILTEHFWLCFDRTTFLTEHFGKLGFDRTVNGKMFCQKNAQLLYYYTIYIRLDRVNTKQMLFKNYSNMATMV